jgi:DNA polymerase-3 subunit alpha
MGANAHLDYADRKNGRKPVVALHPELAEPLAAILGDTYGLIVYQEQVLLIAQKLAGYSLGKADLLRKAMGKKKKEVLDAEYVPFRDGMRRNGYSDAAISALWDVLVPFSDYAFNKAHTAAYGLVSYWTAFLKANHPAEYMAALLTSVRDDKDKTALYLSECRRMGIKVLPPDVNDSDADFTAVGTDVRFGLAGIRNVGTTVVAGIVAGRSEHGRYRGFNDFLAKVPAVVCNKRVVESLVKAGAFESLGRARRSLAAVHEAKVEAVVVLKRNEAMGQFDLFGAAEETDRLESPTDDDIPELPEWDKTVKLGYEREMLGLYVSDHPLLGVEHVLSQAADCSISELSDVEARPTGCTVTIAGLVTSVTRRVTRRGDPWATATVEDLEGSIEVMLFPGTYASYALTIAEDKIVVVRGKLDRREDTATVVVSDISLPDLRTGPRGPVLLSVPVGRCTPPVVERLKDVLAGHPGVTEVHLRLLDGARVTVLRLDERLRVSATPALFGDLKALLGPACLG